MTCWNESPNKNPIIGNDINNIKAIVLENGVTEVQYLGSFIIKLSD